MPPVHYTLYTHFWGFLPHNRIFPGAEFTMHPSLAFSCIGSVTAWHSSSGRQRNCGIEQRAPPMFDRAAITLGISPHSSLLLLLFVSISALARCGLLLQMDYRGLSVCLSWMWALQKIEMPFRMWTWVSWVNHVLDTGPDLHTWRQFWGRKGSGSEMFSSHQSDSTGASTSTVQIAIWMY